MFDFDCQYRIGCDSPAICEWQSKRLGHVVTTSYLFCRQCPINVYKYGQNNKDFLKKCFYRRYDKTFFDKLIKKYVNHTKIICPNNWKIINDQFSFLKKYSWFVDIGLTGSYIVENVENHKDIDIVFWVKDIRSYAEWLKNNNLPEKILDGTKIDYYIFLEPYYQFFISLWPNQKKIFTSKYFSSNISSGEDLKIVYDSTYEKLLEYQDISPID
jgi:hypothetical protein